MAAYDKKLSYQITPIMLTAGIAANVPGGTLPLINLLGVGPMQSAAQFMQVADIPGDLDQAFGAFNVLPGGTLITQSIGKYPFANQAVAANAVIREPLTISLIMDSPMRPLPNLSNDVWDIKKAAFTALKAALERHNNMGGLYSVATPAYIYENLIMLNMTDNSRGNNSLPQNAWRFDFEKPLVALVELQAAYNNLMDKVNSQLPTNGRTSGIIPGQGGSDPTQSLTIKAAGAFVGGAGNVPYSTALTQIAQNYPASAPSPAFPYMGIS